MSRFAKLVRLVAVLAAASQLAVLAYVFARRDFYPYDLEWMEGGMLCHALRLLEHQPIYAAPSVDFIPFLYTPLYPALLALFAKVVGLGYALGRVVSVASFAGATFLAWRFAARTGGSRAAAGVALAIPAANFAETGGFYDLARPDSLGLFLTTAAVIALYRAARDPVGLRRSDGSAHLRAAVAAALFVAAFFAKQTAGPFMVAAIVALAALNHRLLPAFVGTLALLGLPSLWWLNHDSGGWFWRYVFELHQAHAFFPQRAYLETPRTLARLVGPSLVLIPWALLRRYSHALAYATAMALVGVAVACTSFGTQWAFTNAYIPGVFFPSLAVGVAAGRLVSGLLEGGGLGSSVDRIVLRGEGRAPRLRPPLVFALVAASLLLHRPDPRPFIPAGADRAEGDRLIERLRQTPGEVLIPFHPFYAHLAGKRTFVHQMGVMDVGRGGLGVPRGLAEAIRERRFQLVVVDDKIFDKWPWWPGLKEHYEAAGAVPGPRVFSGAATVPTLALTPRSPQEPGSAIDQEIQ